MSRSNSLLSDKTKMWLLIAAILAVGGFFWGLFAWCLFKLRWWTIPVILAAFALTFFSGWLSKKCSKGTSKILSKIISAPVTIFYFILGITQPCITIVGTYLFVGVFTFGILGLALVGLSNVCDWGLLPETICFLVLSGGSILCATSYRITRWIIQHSPLRDWKEHKYESYREQLAIYLIQPSNVVFLLYVAYFIFLVITGYLQIQNNSFFISEGYDAAVLKAFLVFIAYTNMRTKRKEADLDAKELLGQTLKLLVGESSL